MNNNLFCLLVNKGAIAPGAELCISTTQYSDGQPTETIQGAFTVTRIYSLPLVPGTLIDVVNGELELTVTKNDIRMVASKLPSQLGAELGYEPFEIPLQEPEFYTHHPDGRRKRFRLKDSLDVFSVEDYTPDNYVEEVVTRDQFDVVSRTKHVR